MNPVPAFESHESGTTHSRLYCTPTLQYIAHLRSSKTGVGFIALVLSGFVAGIE